ncbi:hypothetical protein ACFXKE_16060, partial [Streptomyces sp. NPDC059202]|uniref:hypothetical protein n=1 Tax=Streptomyces sp. NPDC059202 TaxID=3346768 RepID=UPI00368670EF
TNLALIFGTLLSSQGADASFVPVSRPSGRFLRFLRFPALPTLSDLSDPISSVLSGPFRFRSGPFRRFRLYQILSASDSQSGGFAFPAVGPFRRVRL